MCRQTSPKHPHEIIFELNKEVILNLTLLKPFNMLRLVWLQRGITLR